MNPLFVFIENHFTELLMVVCGVLFDIAILIKWRRLPKTFSLPYKLICLLVGLLTIYSGIMLMRIDILAINPR